MKTRNIALVFLSLLSSEANSEQEEHSAPTQSTSNEQLQYVVTLDSDIIKPALRRARERKIDNKKDRNTKRENISNLKSETTLEVESFLVKQSIIPGEIFSIASTGFTALLTDDEASRLSKVTGVETVVLDERLIIPQYEASQQAFPCSDLSETFYVDRGVSLAGGPVDRSSSSNFIWIVDSGIDLTHPDLNIITNPLYAKSIVGGSPDDDFGHGTLIAGIAAAKYNSIGVSGVAAGAPVVPVKVVSEGLLGGVGATLSAILGALDHVGQSNIEGDVLNLSLIQYSPNCSTQTGEVKTIKDALLEISYEGTWVIAGGGNEASDLCSISDNGWPACINGFHILTVSSAEITAQDQVQCGNYGWGESTDYVTAGRQASLYKDGNCAYTDGTSMSAAVLSGVSFGKGIGENIPYSNTISCCGRSERIANISTLASLRFDVELELQSLSFSNINDWDDGEDLYGTLKFQNISTDRRTLNSTAVNMWRRSEATAANSVGFPEGRRAVGFFTTIASNLSYFDLLTSKIKVSGDLYDDEGAFPSRPFTCTNCGSDGISREFDFSKLPVATASIQALTLTDPPSRRVLNLRPSPVPWVLTPLDSVIMTFAENGDHNSGYVTSIWRVWIKVHP